MIDEAITALGSRKNVYQRGGMLVHVISGKEPPKGIERSADSPRITSVRNARVRELLALAAYWYLAGDEEQKPIHPPQWVILGITARDQWSEIPRIEAVVEVPVMRADGTILQNPGFDKDTGILFMPQRDFPTVPERPTRDHAVAARDALLEVVEDFPFANNSHLAAWVAGVLTPLARYAFDGPSPLFLHDANVRGCGKSLLTDAVALITAALTATTWSDRILGQSAMASALPGTMVDDSTT